MHSLQNRPKSDCESDISIDDLNIEENSGWNTRTELDRYVKNKDLDKNISAKLIHKANKIVHLSQVIFNYNIKWVSSDLTGEWIKAVCPFPSHQDNTPSFGYNATQGRFNCFGCRRAGNTVQFISFIEGRSHIEVAKDLLCKFESPESIIDDLENEKPDEASDLLSSFSDEIRLFIYNNIDNDKSLCFVENITWNLRVYLEKHALNGSIKYDSLNARIEKIRQCLSNFGKKE